MLLAGISSLQTSCFKTHSIPRRLWLRMTICTMPNLYSWYRTLDLSDGNTTWNVEYFFWFQQSGTDKHTMVLAFFERYPPRIWGGYWHYIKSIVCPSFVLMYSIRHKLS